MTLVPVSEKPFLHSPKKANGVRVRVVRTQFDTRLDAAQHNRVGRLHNVTARQHVMACLLVQQLQYPGIPVRGANRLGRSFRAIYGPHPTPSHTHAAYLIFSSSLLEKNTFRRSVTMGSSYFLSISLPAEYLSSSLDQATRTAYGRWCGFN